MWPAFADDLASICAQRLTRPMRLIAHKMNELHLCQQIGAPAYLIEAKTLNLSSLCKNAEAAGTQLTALQLPQP